MRDLSVDLPVIGITTSLNDGEQHIDQRYIQAIVRAGGWPVIIPMFDDSRLMESLADQLDGLIISGGPAIEKGIIGQLPADLPETDCVRLETDLRLMACILSENKPFLGICYGMQLLSAHLGGTIYADLEAQLPSAGPHSEKRGAKTHRVDLTPGSTLHRLFGADSLVVNSRHIQSIATPGDQLVITARAPDGVVEGIESKDGCLIGVQFHPERMGETGAPLFRHLIRQARNSMRQ